MAPYERSWLVAIEKFSMPIFKINNRRYTFVHVPKTGGSSVEAWLASLGTMSLYSSVVPDFMKCTPQHLTMDDLAIVNSVPSEKAFCIVRDPYTRAESEYFFRVWNTEPCLRPGFSVWLMQQLDRYRHNRHHLDNHFLPQAYFVTSKVRVFRFEAGFEEVFRGIAEYLDVPCPEEIRHLNGHRADAPVWSNELLDNFNSVYACDFEAFGYEQRSMSLHQPPRLVEATGVSDRLTPCCPESSAAARCASGAAAS